MIWKATDQDIQVCAKHSRQKDKSVSKIPAQEFKES